MMLGVKELMKILVLLPDAYTYPQHVYHVVLHSGKMNVLDSSVWTPESKIEVKVLKFIKEYERGRYFWSLKI